MKDSIKKDLEELKSTKQELEDLKQEVAKLKNANCKGKKTIINNITNNTNNTNNGLIQFKYENLSDLLKNEMDEIVSKRTKSIEESVRRTHFNNKRPERQNIFISNMKNNHAHTYDGNKMMLTNDHELIDTLFHDHLWNIEKYVNNEESELTDLAKRQMKRFLII
jgi:hypothetical protein